MTFKVVVFFQKVDEIFGRQDKNGDGKLSRLEMDFARQSDIPDDKFRNW